MFNNDNPIGNLSYNDLQNINFNDNPIGNLSYNDLQTMLQNITALNLGGDILGTGNVEDDLSSQPVTQHSSTIDPEENHIVIKQAIDDGKITEDEVPEEFCCALSFQFITMAVYSPEDPNIKYELTEIANWLEKNQINPFTKSPLKVGELIVDDLLNQKISDFIETKGLKVKSIARP